VYFDTPGEIHTQESLRIAVDCYSVCTTFNQ
jgi:hypothetical protein